MKENAMMDFTPIADPRTSLYSIDIDYNGSMCLMCREHIPLVYDNERGVYREEVHICEVV